jgi:cobyrinic acid a,c-diamide synthase
MKGFLIAGPASGVGKTTVSLAICAGLQARGFRVQAFKCGPDFLDTGHLGAITKRPARNLDRWMLNVEDVRAAFAQSSADADVAVVEGMMGLFDGIAGQGEKGSAAEIAKILSLQVILVVDASKSARSIAAVIRGFEVFDPELSFAGLMLNGVAGESHFRLLSGAITPNCSTPILGWFPQEQAVRIPERHLGLHTAAEMDWREKHRALQELAEKQLNLGLLLAPEFELPKTDAGVIPPKPAPRVTIGVARDEAFSFYYQDNLDFLERSGAKLVEFSPLRDAHLPPELDALYLGGGYPELHAEQLSSNSTLASDIGQFAISGRPVYAECGGMMYLGEQLRTRDGKVHAMTGVLPIKTEMTEKLVRFGYVEVELLLDSLIGLRGTVLRGHSFHCSQCLASRDLPAALEARYTLSKKTGAEGFACGNVFASYIHLHFRGAPSIPASIVGAAERVARRFAEVQ